MAYEILKTVDLNDTLDKNIDVLKYAILKRNDQYFVQIKLFNKTDKILNNLVITYHDGEGVKTYNAKNLNALAKSTFFERNLIELPSESFRFMSVESKEKEPSRVVKGTPKKEVIKQEKQEQVDERDYTGYRCLIELVAFLLVGFIFFISSFIDMGIGAIETIIGLGIYVVLPIILGVVILKKRTKYINEGNYDNARHARSFFIGILKALLIAALFMAYGMINS